MLRGEWSQRHLLPRGAFLEQTRAQLLAKRWKVAWEDEETGTEIRVAHALGGHRRARWGQVEMSTLQIGLEEAARQGAGECFLTEQRI